MEDVVVYKHQEEELLLLWKWYQTHWLDFVRDVLQVELEPQQKKLIQLLQDNDRVEMLSCHSCGKTFCSACVVLTIMSLYPYSTCFTSAPTARQVEQLLWTEISRRYHSSLLPQLGFPEPMTKTWKIGPGWAAYGASSDESVNVEGFHSPTMMMVIFDEAKGIDDAIFTAVEGAMNSPISKQLRISTPGRAAGEMYECSEGSKKHLWQHLHISAEEIPRLSKWVKEREIEWGRDSPVFRMRVLGLYSDEGLGLVFPEACLRMFEENATTVSSDGPRVIGVDVARFGADKTVFTYRYGNMLMGQESFMDLKSTEIADKLKARCEKHKADFIVVDSIGYGAGVLDALAKIGLEHKAQPFTSLTSAFDPTMYANRKAEVAFKIKKKIEDGEVGGRLERVLKDELREYTYIITNKEQYRIVDPDDSPDFGDSFLMAFSMDEDAGPACYHVDAGSDEAKALAPVAERKGILEEVRNGRYMESGRGRIFSHFQ